MKDIVPVEGLGDKLGDVELGGPDYIFFGGLGGDEKDGDVAETVISEQAKHIKAADVGHGDVQHDRVEVMLVGVDDLNGRQAVFRFQNFKVFLQDVGEDQSINF